MIAFFILSYVSNTKDKLANDINLLNEDTNTKTKRLVHKPEFYSIVIDLSKPCASENIREMCKTDTCSRPSILDNNQVAPSETYNLFIDKVGTRIDLRKVPPEYTGYKEGAREVWKSVYNIAKDLRRLVSGIHFSVTVHMAANYEKDDNGKYLSNVSLYRAKYKEEYETNLFLTYIVVRSAVIRLKFSETESLVDTLKEQGDVQNVKWKKLFKNYEQFFDSADQYLDCIECGTCKLWGKIQFKGLKAAIDVLKEKEISKEDMVYLINFFNKLSNTIENAKMFNFIVRQEKKERQQKMMQHVS